MAAMYFALCQNFKLFFVDLHLKTFQTELKHFSDTKSVKCKEFELNMN